MQYTLMHKNIAVADMELDEATSSIQRIDAVYRPEHLPVATASKRDGVDRAALNAWWIDRCIPASRSGVRKALETLELPNTQVLLTRCFGLSLSDQYWVRPHGSDLRWERINFFEIPSRRTSVMSCWARPRTRRISISVPQITRRTVI